MSKQDETLDLAGEVQEGDPLVTALVKINVTDKVLADMRAEAESLPTPKAGDKAGFEMIKAKRLIAVKLRTKSVATLTEMGEEAFKYHRKVTGKRGEIEANIKATEAIIQAKEDAYLAELKAIEDEKARLEVIRIDTLIAQLSAFEWAGNRFEVAQDSPLEFAARLDKARDDFAKAEALRAAEADRVAREEQERKDREAAIAAEEERQAKVRLEQEAAAAELKAKQDAFEKQQRDAEEAERLRQLKIKEDADKADRDRLAALAETERVAREAAEAETRRLQSIADAKAKEEADAKAAEAERARLAALAPDKEKIVEFADNLLAEMGNTIPTTKDPILRELVDSAAVEIGSILRRLRSNL